MEYYISHLKDDLSRHLLKYRTANHKLPVETGRYNNTPYEDRKCNFCNDIGDEYHYIMQCEHFIQDRKKYVNKYYYTHPNMFKYKELMTSVDVRVLCKLSTFVNKIMKAFR